jgi:hypothetical protein
MGHFFWYENGFATIRTMRWGQISDFCQYREDCVLHVLVRIVADVTQETEPVIAATGQEFHDSCPEVDLVQSQVQIGNFTRST